MSHAQIVLCSVQTDSFTFHSICLSFLYSDSLTLWTPAREHPYFSSLNGVISVMFQACFQHKRTGCASDVSENDLSLYSLLGLPSEKPEACSYGHQTKSL